MLYKVSVYETVYETVREFKDRDEARLWGAEQRKHFANERNKELFDLWFDIEEHIAEEHDDANCEYC